MPCYLISCEINMPGMGVCHTLPTKDDKRVFHHQKRCVVCHFLSTFFVPIITMATVPIIIGYFDYIHMQIVPNHDPIPFFGYVCMVASPFLSATSFGQGNMRFVVRNPIMGSILVHHIGSPTKGDVIPLRFIQNLLVVLIVLIITKLHLRIGVKKWHKPASLT